MRDNFKKYIEDQSEDFKFSFDTDKGWKGWQKKQPKSSKRTIWMVAASLLLLMVAAVVLMAEDETQPQKLSEWQEVEMFYQGQINQMTTLVGKPSTDKEILYDLEQMDRAFAETQADLKDDAANEEVIEAMMNHYRLKLSILEKMLEEIRENHDEESTISEL